jgi:hypothetical protein
MKSSKEQGSSQDFDGVDVSSTSGRESEPTDAPVKATKDEKLVRGARFIVMMALFLSAIIVATLAYVLLSKSEHDSFVAQVSFVCVDCAALCTSNGGLSRECRMMSHLCSIIHYRTQSVRECRAASYLDGRKECR